MNLAGISDALRPVAGRDLDVMLVVDTGSSMEIWQPIVSELTEILARRSGFRTVRTRRMNCVTATLDTGGGPARGQVVLVVTDTIATGWRSGAVCRRLAKWGAYTPVAVVNLLPQRLWMWGGLAPRRMNLVGALHTEEGVVVPVLGLDAEWWSGWARLLAGERPMATTAVLTRPDQPLSEEPPEAPMALSPRKRVLRFRTFASVEAFQLAALLACAPLSLPIMRYVHQAILPRTDLSLLAEVLLGGLLRRMPGPGPVTFDFLDGVRQELLAGERRADTVRTVRVLGELSSDDRLRNFRDAVDDPDGVPVLDPTAANLPYLEVQEAVFRALSGRYAPRAARLRVAIQTSRGGGEHVTGPTPATQPARAPASRPQIWGAVPLRNPDFVGRDAVLDQLRRRLIEPGATAVLPEALHGMGGVGKSQTVVEYIYRHAAEYDLVWWIPAEHGSLITGSFVELAKRFDLPSGSAEVAIPAVLEALRRAQPPFSRWLLVFDNADRPEHVSHFFPASGHIVVTSRNAQWAGVARTVEVDVFTRAESIELLRRRGGDISEVDADRLAEALGDLPLAIEQAAAWHKLTGMPVEEYLRLLDEHLPELLGAAPRELNTAGYRPSVMAAWNVTMNKLRREHPAALLLLQVCAFFGPEPISRNLLLGARDGAIYEPLAEALSDPVKLDQAIYELNRHNLIKIDHRHNTIQLHRLIQAVVKNRLSEAEQREVSHSVHLLLAYGVPGDPASPKMWPRYAELLSHATNSGVINCFRPDVRIRRLLGHLVSYLINRGDFVSVQEFARQVWELWKEKLGRTHPDTLAMAWRYGVSLRRTGRLREARELNTYTYELARVEFGENSELVFRIADACIADLRSQGLFGEELVMQQNLFDRARQLLGEDDPFTLACASNLASCLRLNGRFEIARDIDEEAFQRKTIILGAEHPGTFASRNAYAMDLRECGDWSEACDVQEEALIGQREVLGIDHPVTIGAIRNLAVTRRLMGNYDSAYQLAIECVNRYRSKQGGRHVDTLTAEMCLSADLRELSQFTESARIGRRCYEVLVETHGGGHPYTLIAANNLGIILRLLGEVREAYTIDRRALTQFRSIFGFDHPFSLASATNTASDLAALGRYQLAHNLDADTLGRSSDVLGSGHPSTLAVALNRSYDLYLLDRGDEAIPQYRQVLSRLRARLGEDHPLVTAAARAVRVNRDIDTMQL